MSGPFVPPPVSSCLFRGEGLSGSSRRDGPFFPSVTGRGAAAGGGSAPIATRGPVGAAFVAPPASSSVFRGEGLSASSRRDGAFFPRVTGRGAAAAGSRLSAVLRGSSSSSSSGRKVALHLG